MKQQPVVENLQYVYHAVPEKMLGTTLYPLNTLRTIYPEAYDIAAKKYEWRKHFLELTIPRLECLWNDVLHFTIVHPREILNELKAAGYNSNKSYLFYEIPIASLITSPYAVYYTPAPVLDEKTYSEALQAPRHVIDPNRVKLPGEFDFRYSSFPESTSQYFKFEFRHGRIPLIFNGLPHFLLRSPLETTGLHTIDWQTSI